MATKRKKRKAGTSTKKRKVSQNIESNSAAKLISTIVLIFIAVFIALSIFSFGGKIGSGIRSIILSFFGTLGYIFPIIIIVAIIISLFCDNKYLNIKLYSLILFYVLIICLLTSIIKDYSESEDLFNTVTDSITIARNQFGFDNEQFSGGVVGTFITYILYKAVNKEASIAIFVTLTLITFIMLFGMKVPMLIANFFKAIISFITSIPGRLGAKRAEDNQIALDNERILKETYEKSKQSNLEVSYDNVPSESRLVLEPLTPKKKVFDTSKIDITPSEIQSKFYNADSSDDRPQSHLLKELRKKSINEVIYEEKEKGNDSSEFFYTAGMRPIDELSNITMPEIKDNISKANAIPKNEYDVDNDDSIYSADSDSFARGLDDVKRTEVIDKTSTARTRENIEKDGIELKNNNLTEQEFVKKPTKRIKKYKFPPSNLLNKSDRKAAEKDPHLNEKGAILVDTLKQFGVGTTLLNITVGPAVTRYELKPDVGVKVAKILSLENDLQLAMAASSLKIEAPIPGKAAIGIEIANEKSSGVLLGDIIASSEFRNAESKLTVAIGKDISGKPIVTDLRKMPHLLIAGATGSGKSVCINSLITSLIYKSSPEDVRLVMVDPKVVELQVYDGIPHLLVPVVTDAKKAASALNWAVKEMTRRYNLIQEKRVRDIESYNQTIENENKYVNTDDESEVKEKLPYIVIIIDEFADLMLVASKDVENAIMRIAQLARACGIYLVIATQKPTVNIISGNIKANVPSRISFAVSSGSDSQVILDRRGAEKLLGHGDMLYLPFGIPEPIRVQGCYVSESEILDAVNYVKDSGVDYNEEAVNAIDKGVAIDAGGDATGSSNEKDERFVEIGRYVISEQNASIGMIQRHFAMGFNRAARIIDQLEAEGVISKQDGKKSREVLYTLDEFNSKFA